MPLTIQEKVGIRRHLGYPLAGIYRLSPAGGTLASVGNAYRFFESYGQLEYRMDQLAPSEESVLTGKAYGAVGFSNQNTPIVPSIVITVSISSAAFGSSSPVVLEYTVQSTDTLLTICGSLANLAALNGTFTAAGFYATNDYGSGPWSQQIVPFPICSFIAPFGVAFSLTVSGAGNTVPQIVADGALLEPVLYLETTIPATPVYGYLPICNKLESFLLGSVENMSTAKAREWTRNPRELKEKRMILNQWRLRMAAYMGLSIDQNNDAFNKSFGNCGRLII